MYWEMTISLYLLLPYTHGCFNFCTFVWIRKEIEIKHKNKRLGDTTQGRTGDEAI